MRTIVAVALFALASTGCITNSARVINPPGQAQSGVVVSTYHEQMPTELEFHNQRPQDIRITAWKRDPDSGKIYRYDGRCRTPLMGWGRFPMDILIDLAPVDFVIAAEQTVQLREISGDDKSWLEEARRDGYVHEGNLK